MKKWTQTIQRWIRWTDHHKRWKVDFVWLFSVQINIINYMYSHWILLFLHIFNGKLNVPPINLLPPHSRLMATSPSNTNSNFHLLHQSHSSYCPSLSSQYNHHHIFNLVYNQIYTWLVLETTKKRVLAEDSCQRGTESNWDIKKRFKGS